MFYIYFNLKVNKLLLLFTKNYLFTGAFYFFPWHFGFLCRYRPLPRSIFYEMSKLTPLIQNSRIVDEKLREHKYLAPLNIDSGIMIAKDSNFPLETPLEKLLRCDSVDAHLAIATELWNR